MLEPTAQRAASSVVPMHQHSTCMAIHPMAMHILKYDLRSLIKSLICLQPLTSIRLFLRSSVLRERSSPMLAGSVVS